MKPTAYILIIIVLMFCCSCSTQGYAVNDDEDNPQTEPTAIIKPIATNSPIPDSTPEPTETPIPTYDIAEVVDVQEEFYAYIRNEPNDKADIIVGAAIGAGFAIAEDLEVWYKVFYNDQMGYIKKQYVKVRNQKETMPAHTAYAVAPGPDGGLVDIRRYTKDIQIDLLFAKDDNILGYNAYGEDICMMQKSTLDKLMQAQKKFAENGFTIIIYDAYRPYSVTAALAEKYKGSKYVASLGGSVHNRGAAVDMSILDKKGNLVDEMPSPVHTLNQYSNRDNIEMLELSKWFMDYVEDVMLDSGFLSIRSEWWHFNDVDYKRYEKTDYVLTDLLKVVFE